MSGSGSVNSELVILLKGCVIGKVNSILLNFLDRVQAGTWK